MQVPLLDLKREYATIKDQIDRAVMGVLAETRFINGPQVTELEQAIASYCGCKYAVGVASGTDALLLSLRTAGIGRGDEVIIPCFSFFATAGAVCNVGATPVFVDINADNFNIDVSKIQAAITDKTKAIMPVHLFGQCADMEPIMEIARQNNLVVVEDAAQSISAKYKGKTSGTIGDFGCFSFFPTKNLGCAGDGGMVVTNNEKYDTSLRKLKAHGDTREYHHELIGYNSRLDTIHAAVLLVKLPHLDGWSEARRKNADYYDSRFKDTAIIIPTREPFAYHIFNQYTIRVQNSDQLKTALQNANIGCKTYYPLPLHLQECFNHLGYQRGDMPVAEECAQQVLSIPIFPMLSEDEREYVADTILRFTS